MRLRSYITILLLTAMATISCARKNDMEPVIKFKTTEGTIVVKLYPKTPKHRDNFVKLVESGYYNGVLFHRVISDFMIQAGDPDSKNAGKKAELGSGDVKYTIDAEIVYPQYYHKKGALAAARQGDQVNPKRESSGAQFYFVQGRIFTDKELDALEKKNAQKLEMKLFKEIEQAKITELNKYKSVGNQDKINELRDSILLQVHEKMNQNPSYKFTEAQRNDYKTIGGTPHLDGEYTVFGEVIKGLEIVTNISRKKTGKLDRPLEDIRILKAKRIR